MPRDLANRPAENRAARLNALHSEAGAEQVLAAALDATPPGRLALVSSFGADSAVLLHLISVMAPSTPVLFIDTMMLFSETLTYQQELAATLGLTDVRRIEPDRAALFARDPDALLHRSNPDACCALRKTATLEAALDGFDGWISGRKRFQGSSRAALEHFETDAQGRLKVNPLAHWGPADIAAYMDGHDLPRHPLVARGYPSIGCAPCTTPVQPGEPARAGRWRGRDKEECGIHISNGRIVRGAQEAGADKPTPAREEKGKAA